MATIISMGDRVSIKWETAEVTSVGIHRAVSVELDAPPSELWNGLLELATYERRPPIQDWWIEPPGSRTSLRVVGVTPGDEVEIRRQVDEIVQSVNEDAEHEPAYARSADEEMTKRFRDG
jgi:hypothetical protein